MAVAGAPTSQAVVVTHCLKYELDFIPVVIPPSWIVLGGRMTITKLMGLPGGQETRRGVLSG